MTSFELHPKNILIPNDVKLISAQKTLPLLNGNVFITPNYDVIGHITRLKGYFSNLDNPVYAPIIKKLDFFFLITN